MTTTLANTTARTMAPEKPINKDEPWLTLPTVSMVAAIAGCCAAAAGLWVAGSLALGYSGEIAATGAFGAAMVLVLGTLGYVLIFPWMAKPASTAMLLWLTADVLSMLMTLAAAYLLYSATFIQSHPLLLGVALAYVVTLLGKVALVALHMRKHFS